MRLPIVVMTGIVLHLSSWPLSAAPSPGEAARAAIRRHDLQDRMPVVAPPDDSRPWFRLDPDILRILLWASVILGAAVVIYSLRDSLPMFDRSRKLSAADDERMAEANADAMDEARLAADDLAKLGRFVDAMHVLLLQCLTELRKRLDISFSDSLTSREILHRVQLSDAGRAAFATIVREVERTHFGEQAADLRDYLWCRDQFEALKNDLDAGHPA
jgi:hypothetical protein